MDRYLWTLSISQYSARITKGTQQESVHLPYITVGSWDGFFWRAVAVLCTVLNLDGISQFQT